MAFLLGLTGNIACGKSSVGRLLAERYGADYIDADRLVHELYAAGTPETRAIAERFGADLLTADGTIDRRRLGDLVLADPAALRDLEAILDPGVRRAIEHRIESSTASVVVLDAMRLIEAGLAARCDAVWVVACEPEAQVQRLHRQRAASRPSRPRCAWLRRAPRRKRSRHATRVLSQCRHASGPGASRSTRRGATSVPPQRVQSSPP